MIKTCTLIVVMLCCGITGICQKQSYYFKNYQVSDGLSGNTIGPMIQDKKGFIWLASRNGLNRFDGRSFRIFRKIPGDSTSLGDNHVRALYEDNQERIWIGTSKGVYKYDPGTERISLVPFPWITGGEVIAIKEDKAGNIWMIAWLQLCRYDVKNKKLIRYGLKKDNAVSLSISKEGVVLCGMASGKIRKYNHETGKFQNYNVGSLITKKGEIIATMVLQATSDSTVLVGNMKRLWSFNFNTGIVRDISSEVNLKEDIYIHSIYENSDGKYWIGAQSALFILDLKKKKIERIKKQLDDPNSISDNVTNTIFRDREGGIWVSTQYGGVNYYSDQFNFFKKYIPRNSGGISGYLIHHILKDKYNRLWIGTEDAGLNQLDIKTEDFKWFLPDGKKGSIAYHGIHGMVEDGDKLWIGTYDHGLDVMDLKSNKIIRHYSRQNTNDSLRSDFINTIYKTRNGEILIGLWSGLYKYNRKTDNFSRSGFFEAWIQHIYEDKQGTIWGGSYGRGIFYLNPTTGVKGRIEHNPVGNDGLSNDYVNSVFQSQDGAMWFCTEDGLSSYNMESKQITNYTTNDGLPDNQVFRIEEDNNGNLWISSSRGLAMLDRKSNAFTTYTKADGLPSDQFNYGSSFKSEDGTLFFGTVSGMISFNPSNLIKNHLVPNVYITSLQINGKDIDLKTRNSPLKKSISYTKHLELDYQSSNLTFEVASLSYVNSEHNQYQYQMEGLDNEWHSIDNNGKIYFAKLSPGEYVLRVKGSNNDLVWNDKETKLTISIRPPIWATVWAYILYGAVASAIVALILRYYYMAMKEKNQRRIEQLITKQDREIYSAKIDFFTNIAHEIRTPLTLIKMPIDKMLSYQGRNNEDTDNLNVINKNTGRLIELTNQLLDFRKVESNNYSFNYSETDINSLLHDQFEMFRPIAVEKKIEYLIDLPENVIEADVDVEVCKKIIGNLISNALKYANTFVKVQLFPLNSGEDLFHIEFTNDGTPIGELDKEKIFTPFYRIESDKHKEGTGIGLPLARSLAELHKGSLLITKEISSTIVFRLSLPVSQDHKLDYKKKFVYQSVGIMRIPDENLPEGSPDKPVVLLVEDNVEILGYLAKHLFGLYNIKMVGNGQEAIDLLTSEDVHVVVSDIMMPVMDGIELCKKMKSDLRFSHLPILLLTAKTTIESKIEGLTEGADAYIEKPFSMDHLTAQIANLIRNRKFIKEYFANSPLVHIKEIAISKTDKQFIERLESTILDRIGDDRLDTEALAELMNMSRSTLFRKIKGISNLTPNELINLFRLKKAAELLAENNLKVSEVAYAVGYSIPSNFSRDFQKRFGLSPSSYVINLTKKPK
jgi:ligand-binding sensor domain-containing protein/signal transduction histidine kinase/DNA-binding response OmpR family regulator